MYDNDKIVVSRSGIGLFGILFIVLLVLKVGIGETAVMGWSWWIITAPLWITPALMLVFLTVVALVAVLAVLITVAANAIAGMTKKNK